MYHHYCSQKSYDRDLIIVSIHRCINKHIKQLVVQSLSCVWLFATPWMQHTRLPCLPPSPKVCSNSCPLNQWCHPAISSSATPFSSGPQSFPASGSFPMSWLSISGGQSTAASVSASVLPMNIQGSFPGFPVDWLVLLSPISRKW